MDRKAAAVLAAALFLGSAAPAGARDDRLLLTIEGALSTPEAKDRLDDTVRFYFGNAAHPEPAQSFDVHTISQKTSALARSDLEACDRAFLYVIIAFRDKAKALGANAVVNLKNMYKNREFVSETQYECRAGYLQSSVTLEGQIVRLPAAAGARTPH